MNECFLCPLRREDQRLNAPLQNLNPPSLVKSPKDL